MPGNSPQDNNFSSFAALGTDNRQSLAVPRGRTWVRFLSE